MYHRDGKTQSDHGPCDDCENRRLCRRELLACPAFAAYTELRRWHDKSRMPTRKLYRSQFGGSNER